MKITRQFTITVIQDGKEKVIHQGSTESLEDVELWAKNSPTWEFVDIKLKGKTDQEVTEIYAQAIFAAREVEKDFIEACESVPVSFHSMVGERYRELKNERKNKRH